jgi:hypothetical protein
MSDASKTSKRKVPLRRTLVRAALVLVYIALMVLVFFTGKGHTLLVDNKDVAGTDLKAYSLVKITVDNLKPSEETKGDRDMFKIKGQTHRIVLEVPGDPNKIVRSLTVPMGSEIVLISIPKLAAGLDPFETFVPAEAVTPDREAQTFTSADSGEAATPSSEVPVLPTP